MLKKDKNIDDDWKKVLNRCLGDDSWEDDLYFEMINGAGYGSPSVMLRRQLIIGKGEMR